MLGKVKKGKGDKNGKGKDNADATEYFAGYCLGCKAWGHMKKYCWWNETPKSGKDTASLESASTAVCQLDSTITGMLLEYDGRSTAVDVTKWMFSLSNRESNRNEVLVDSGSATSVCQHSGWQTGRSWSGTEVGHWATIHQDRAAHRSSCARDGVNVSGDFQIAPQMIGCRDHSYQLDRMLTEATLSYFAVLVEGSSTTFFVIGSSSNKLVVEGRHVSNEGA